MLSNAQPKDHFKTRHRGSAVLELISAIVLLESAVWTTSPLGRILLGVVASILILRIYGCYARHSKCRPAEKVMGDSTIILFSMAIALVVCGVFLFLDLWSPSAGIFSQRSMWDWAMVKIPTVVLQQLLFQLVFIPTLYFITLNARMTVVTSAFVFGLLHMPNPLLMILTFLVGLGWFALSVSRSRLIPITASHLLLAVVIANVADEYVLDMRVGQACFQKWPRLIQGHADGSSLAVYPRVIEGTIDSVTQEKTRVSISGKVYDAHRGKPPATVFVVFGKFDPADEEGTSWSPQKITATSNIDPAGRFTFTLDSSHYSSATEIRIFVRHRIGWCYPVNDSARIEIHACDFSRERICLYPGEIHGNIGHVKHRQQRTDLIGWGFDLKSRQLLESLLVLHQQNLVSVPLERRERKEISNYYSDDKILNCGFISRVPFAIDQAKTTVYVRNSKGILERLPMDLSHQRLSLRKDSTIHDSTMR